MLLVKRKTVFNIHFCVSGIVFMSNLPDAFARSSLLIGHEAQATGSTDQISTKGERFKAQYPVSLVMATMTQ